MITLFEFSDYRKVLLFLMKAHEGEPRGLQTRLAKHMGCQQAYLSRVLAGNAELSQEQAFAATSFFNLDTLEQDYFVTLVSLNRAGSTELKRFYEKKRSEILTRKLEIKSRIKADGHLSAERKTLYYSDWAFAAVHMATAIGKFRTVPALASRLGLPEARTKEILEFLEECGLIEKKAGYYQTKVAAIHLGNDQALIKSHHTNWRLQALNAISKNSPDVLNYSSIVSCSANDSVRIREVLLKAIQEIREIVRGSASEQLYCYSLDFFDV
jgi:uncharacterized protein (TIGR02147 family)